MLGVIDGGEDGGGREEAAFLALGGLLGEEEDGLVGVPVLVEVAVLLVRGCYSLIVIVLFENRWEEGRKEYL